MLIRQLIQSQISHLNDFANTPESAPTPSPAIKRPIVICASEVVVPVWMAVPTVKIADQMRMDPFLPRLSDVNACPKAPLITLSEPRYIMEVVTAYTNVLFTSKA